MHNYFQDQCITGQLSIHGKLNKGLKFKILGQNYSEICDSKI